MKDDKMIWGFMVQLGHNMWREEPLYGKVNPEERERDYYAQPFNRTDVKVWNEITECYAKKGANALIDMRWGETLAENGVTTEGDVTTIRLTSGKTIRCATFRNLSEREGHR